jgi:hypothetical protein
VPDSFPVRFVRGVAQHAADKGLGVFRLTGAAYANPERGIRTDGIVPTTIDNCLVLTARRPIADGRANLILPVQFFSRTKGTPTDAQNYAWSVVEAFDQRENLLPELNVAWSWLFSQADFQPDTNGRVSVAQTFYFRTRRPVVGGQ